MAGRPSGRAPDELRAVKFTRRFTQHAEGSVLVEFEDGFRVVTSRYAVRLQKSADRR